MEKSKKVIGAGLMVAAVAAATYFLTGKRGRANREKISAWTLDLKAEVLRRMRQLKVMNREVYHGGRSGRALPARRARQLGGDAPPDGRSERRLDPYQPAAEIKAR